MKSKTPWNEVVLSILGICFTLFAAYTLFAERALESRSEIVRGTVVDLTAKDLTGQAAGYAPVVEWSGPDGETRRITGTVASNPPAYNNGQQVIVRYDPNNPEMAKIGTSDGFSLQVLLFGAMGITFAILGLARVIPFLVQRRRNAV
ncbi:MAG: DUF3592 domain-containing protein [Pseudomonadota bacterium]